MDKWKARWFAAAEECASWSEDESTQVGAVIVSKDNDRKSEGWNGLPRGVDMIIPPAPEKYLYMEHAERNAIYNAGRNGVSLKGTYMYTTHYPCADCARAIIQAGIKKVFYRKKLATEKWIASNNASEIMFIKAGITTVYVSAEQLGRKGSPPKQEHQNS